MKKFHESALALFLLIAFISIQSVGLIRGQSAGDSERAVDKTQASRITLDRAGLSERVTLHPAGQGRPGVNLQDGHDLIAAYTGPLELKEAMERNQARPLALASGDYDEDGVPDLISGYALSAGLPTAAGRGLITLHRGNVDAIYPNTLEAEQRKATGQFTEAPFLSPARIFELPEEPDFIGAGDFDADGHWDVAAATKGSDKLFWLAGDGHGGFGPAQTIELDGRVTALTAGEINRADGLPDVLVAIAGADGPQVLVFEHPNGALRAGPEVFPLPAEASALAIGQFDDNFTFDLAVAAGTELVIVRGRDRMLSYDSAIRAAVAPAKIDRTALSFAVTAMTVGNFNGDNHDDLALLSADGIVHVLGRNADGQHQVLNEVAAHNDNDMSRVGPSLNNSAGAMSLLRARLSSGPGDDLIVIDGGGQQLQLLSSDSLAQQSGEKATLGISQGTPGPISLKVEGVPVAVLPMRLNKDALSDIVVLKNSGEPIAIAATAPASIITVNSSADTTIRDSVLTLAEAALLANGFLLKSALTPAEQAQVNGTPVKPGLDEIRFSVSSVVPAVGGPGAGGVLFQDAVTLDGTIPGGRVELNGVNTTQALAVGFAGVNSANSVVRGLVINRFQKGVEFTDGSGGNNILEGCYIGTNLLGNTATGCAGSGGCFDAVAIRAPNNTVGGTVQTARNIISGYQVGIRMSGSSLGTQGNKIQGNYIGTDASGTQALANSGAGIYMDGNASTVNNIIGGTILSSRNIISGVTGGNGIQISGGAGTLIQGNYIGTNADGTAAIANSGKGIDISQSNGSTIGGTTPTARNVVSGSLTFAGISLSGSSNSLIQGNYIGVNRDNTGAIGNRGNGIVISGTSNNNLIGSAEGGAAANVIANNGSSALTIALGNGNGVRRNSIFNLGVGNKSISLGSTANNGAKAPVLTLAGNGTVQGTINSTPSTTFTIEFFQNNTCDPSKEGEARDYLSPLTISTNSSGAAAFNAPAGGNLTATATDTNNNTSEVSRCVASVAPPVPPTITLNPTQLTFNANEAGANPPSQTVTLTNTGGSTLNWQATPSDLWLSVTSPSGTSGILTTNQSTVLTVSAKVGSLTPLIYNGTITISSANASNSPASLNVAFNVAAVTDSIKIVPGTERVNGATLDNLVLTNAYVVFSCDVEYQLTSDPLGGSISLIAKDFSGVNLNTYVIGRSTVIAERTGDPKTKHLTFQFRIPENTLQKSIPALQVNVELRNSAFGLRAQEAGGTIFSPRDWAYVVDATANGVVVYSAESADRREPAPDSNGKINVVLHLTYLLNSGPGTEVVDVKNATGAVYEQHFPLTPTSFPSSIDLPFSIADTADGLGSLDVLTVLNLDQPAQIFNFYVRPAPNANYPFDGSRNSSARAPNNSDSLTNLRSSNAEGATGESLNVGPALADLINPGTSTANIFATDTVDGASSSVLKFPYNNGLALSPTTGVVSNNSYTVVMLLKFDEANKRRRILDFKNGASDNGLYAEADNNLRFVPAASGSGGPITANKYVQVVITRNAAGVVTGYINGTQQFQFTDTNNDAVIDSNNTLRFFQDNTSGSGTGEASAGSFARLRLYGRALSSTEIAGLDREPSGVNFSAANYSVNEGSGSATITVNRTGATSLPATVDYTTNDETAKQPNDYTIASGTLSFAAGETSKTFQVQVTDNGLVDLDRQVVLFLQNPNGVALDSQSVAVLTISDNDTAATTWESVVLTAPQAEIKTWTTGGRTYAYLKLLFPNAGYRVTNWGQAIRAVNDFTADAAIEKSSGQSVQAVTTTAGIYDLGTLSPGSYNFTFKNTGTLVKTLPFTIVAPPFPVNSIDVAREFVKQQYRDFLNREADQAGEDFWTDNITKCSDPARRPAGQTEAQCTLRQRETTSGAFFLSPEFQYTGYYVYRMYQGGLGRQPKLSEFIPDAQFVGSGIIVNGQLSAAKINQNKADYAQQFVNCTDAAKYRCAEFKAIYDGLNNQEYVDALFVKTGANPSTSERAALVSGLNAIPATETRASVLQKVVDGIVVIAEGNQQFTTTYGQAFYNSESNRAFVLLEYFGYMKRDPDDAGYAFWLGKLNQFGGNFVNAEMVLAFISSPEYRARFGQP